MTEKRLTLTPTVKAAWIAALRSGKYAQGQGYLARTRDGTTSYCCLGVLAKVTDQLVPSAATDFQGLQAPSGNVLPGGPPDGWMDLPEDQVGQLVAMNDATGPGNRLSFPGIADWIEANVESTPCE